MDLNVHDMRQCPGVVDIRGPTKHRALPSFTASKCPYVTALDMPVTAREMKLTVVPLLPPKIFPAFV